MQLEVQWIASKPTSSLSWNDPQLQRYFDVKAHPGLVSQFNIPDSYTIVPHAIRPRNGFYRILTRNSQEFNREVSNQNLGTVNLGNRSGEIKSITGEVFPGVLIARVKASVDITSWPLTTNNLRDLQSLRSPRNLAAVDRSIRTLYQLAVDGSNTQVGDYSYRDDYFAMQLKLTIPPAQIENAAGSSLRDLVSLLIGTPDPDTLTEYLVDSVSSASERLNQKSAIELMMLNRQGMLYLLSSERYFGPHTARFCRTADMACLAMFAATFFENRGYALRHPNYSHFIGRRIKQWIDEPRLVFRSSESNKITWDSLSTSFALEDHLRTWTGSDQSNNLEQPSATSQVTAPREWWLDPEFSKILEVNTELSHNGVEHIHDTEIRGFVIADRTEASRCRATGNFRAAVVMAGAAIEGILLDIVLSHSLAPRESALKLGFQRLIAKCCPQYIEDPKNLGGAQRLIRSETALLLDRVFRDWRNYVHPGLAVRSNQEVTQATADAAIAALDLLLEELL